MHRFYSKLIQSILLGCCVFLPIAASAADGSSYVICLKKLSPTKLPKPGYNSLFITTAQQLEVRAPEHHKYWTLGVNDAVKNQALYHGKFNKSQTEQFTICLFDHGLSKKDRLVSRFNLKMHQVANDEISVHWSQPHSCTPQVEFSGDNPKISTMVCNGKSRYSLEIVIKLGQSCS